MQTNSTLVSTVTPSTPSTASTPSTRSGASLAGAQVVPHSGVGRYSSSTRLRGMVNTQRQRLTGKQIAQRVQKLWLKDVKRLDFDKLKALAEALPPMHPVWAVDAAASKSVLHEGVAMLKSAAQSADDKLGRMLTLPGAVATSVDDRSCAVDDTDCVEEEPRLGMALFLNKHKGRFGFGHAEMPSTETLEGKLVVVADVHTSVKYQKTIVKLLKDARAGDEFWGETAPELISRHHLHDDLVKRGVICKGVDLPDAGLMAISNKMNDELVECLAILDPVMAHQIRAFEGPTPFNLIQQKIKEVTDGATEKQLAALGAKAREEFKRLREAARKTSEKLDQMIDASMKRRDDNFIQLISKALAEKQNLKKTVWFVVGVAHVVPIQRKFMKEPRLIVAGPLDYSELA